MAEPGLWEVFLRERAGLSHRHIGCIVAGSADLALHAARNLYTRRGHAMSLWVVPASAVVTSGGVEPGSWFDNGDTKPFRTPDHFEVPEGVSHL